MVENSFEFALSTRLWRGKPLDFSCFREAREHGYEALEIFKTSGHFSGLPREIDAVKRSVKIFGVRVESLHSDLWLLAPLDIASFRNVGEVILQNLDLLSELGGKFLIIHLAVFADPDNMMLDEESRRFLPGLSLFRDLDRPESGAVERIKDGLAFYSDEARKRDCIIALETDICKNEMFLGLLSNADPRGCGICFDSGHAEVASGAVEILKLLKTRVVCTHLHDNNSRQDLHLPPFRGVVDWPALLAELSSAGYNGKYTFECGEKIEDLVEAKDKLARLMVGKS